MQEEVGEVGVGGIYIAREALPPAAPGAGGLLLPVARQLGCLKLVTIVGVHDGNNYDV